MATAAPTPALPIQLLLGVYLGVLTGVIPAIVGWGLGFIFKYFTGVTIPGFGVVVLGVAIAGINGGLLALNDPTITKAPNSMTIITALIVVLMMTLYAHNMGDKMGASVPRRLSLRQLRDRTLNADVIEWAGGRRQVHIEISGDIGDIEGYPPLSPDLRTEIREKELTFPADLPIAELETRVADTLRTEFELADVAVTLDERGHAAVDAAPPVSGLSKRVPAGKRAVSIDALLPTGLARGDTVRIDVDETTIEGTVVSAQTESGKTTSGKTPVQPDGGATDGTPSPTPEAPIQATAGGEGRLTVAVDRGEAQRLVQADRGRVLVRSRGKHREFELLSLLRRGGRRFRKLTIGTESDLAETTIGAASVRDTYDVAVLAVRGREGWTLAPRGSTPLRAGDEVFVVGTRDNLTRFEAVVT
ncbi:MAG: TrkA C-terminal domain-containing protein [Halobacteriales archaeon]|nr:TrkA C-terminal domain-containing protein [Halobacteriales archaeon]